MDFKLCDSIVRKTHNLLKPWRRIEGPLGQMSCLLHFPPSGQDYVWSNAKEAFNLHYLFPAVKHGDGALLHVQQPFSALKDISAHTFQILQIQCIPFAVYNLKDAFDLLINS